MQAQCEFTSHLGSYMSQLVQNRVHLYNFLLLRIILFNHWVSGLAQEARGSCSRQACALPGAAACPLGRVLRAGLMLIQIPVWLVLRGLRLAWGMALQWLGAWGRLGLSVATCRDLLLSCLHSLMLVALLLLLLTWRLCQKAHRFGLGWLPSKALLGNHVVLEPLALLKCLYWWVVSISWHLAYLVTWTTCLASHLLQAAFEYTAQLAQAQEDEPQEASGSTLPESLTSKAGPVPPEHGAPGE
ncbi:transmembrane protein 270 isoform X2 [Tupaia chinensis]|uniref:transmembrane protein 270 isoform X2 n=1 Tax=Tupaia chinensis TaxID=246437 RepID=UPI0003C8D02B|nr:transmembrane protein 270 isoform X2 [Tupaia chinensis]